MIFWFDLETTGLDEKEDLILEVALVVTEDNMTVRQEYESVIWRNQQDLAKMNDWCKNQHSKSGLITDVLSDKAKSPSIVEAELNQIMEDWYSPNDRPILAGSSVHFDRKFAKVAFPAFESRLHYRMIDVSSFKEGLRRQFGFQLPPPPEPAHRAMTDIKGSMQEYMSYMSMFKVPEKT